MAMLSLIREHRFGFDASAVQKFYRAVKNYDAAMRELSVHFKPKDHMVRHLANRVGFLGSPALYSNWLDESHNRLLRDVAKGFFWKPQTTSAITDRRARQPDPMHV